MIVDGRSLWFGVDGLRRSEQGTGCTAGNATNRRAHAVEKRVCHLLAFGGIRGENVAGGSPAAEHGDELGLAWRRAIY